MWIEHARTSNYDLGETAKPIFQSERLYRFSFKVAPGQAMVQTIAEQKGVKEDREPLTAMTNVRLADILANAVMSEKLRGGLKKVEEQRFKLQEVRDELRALQKRQTHLTSEQEQNRQSLDKLKAGSADHKKALERLEQGEEQLAKAATQVRDLSAAELKQQHENDTYARTLNVK